MKPRQPRHRKYKVAAAGLGAGDFIAMGAITAGTSAEGFILSEPTTGETTTSTTAPTTLETTKAKPEVTASTSQGAWPETSHPAAP